MGSTLTHVRYYLDDPVHLLVSCADCKSVIAISCTTALGYMVYEVIEQVFNSTFNKFTVTYDAISSQVKCQCLLFESKGILCSYSSSALSFERVDKVSTRYILK